MFVFVLGLSFVLLTVAFRALVLAAVAIGLNLLSVGAAYGLIVLVFLKGVGRDLLGFTEVDVIAAWLPLFLFAVLFGLSMDYTVFLLSRIREHVATGEPTTAAVEHAVASTARIITGAALITSFINRPLSQLSLYASYIESLEQGAIAPISSANASQSFPPLKSRQVEFGAKMDGEDWSATA